MADREPVEGDTYIPFDREEQSAWLVYRRLLTYVRAVIGFFLLAILGNIIYAVSSAAMAPAMKYVVEAIENPTPEFRLLVPLLIVVIFTVRGFGTFLSEYFMSRVARSIVHRMRTQIFDHMLRLPNVFFDQNTSGALLSRLTYNVQMVTGAATNAITVLLREGLTIIGLLGYMLYENWKLTLIFLSLGPVIGLLVSYATKRLRRLSKGLQTTMGEVTQVAMETLNGYRVVRIFGGENYESDRFRKASERNVRQQLKLDFTQGVSTPIIQIIISLGIATLIWLALSPEVMEGMTTGEFIAFITAATTCAKPARKLTSINSTLQRGITASTDIFELLAVEPEPDHGQHRIERTPGRIEFRDISFRYPSSQSPVLDQVSLTIEPGQTVAFVGRSGSGKSTLVNLVPRFYELQEGDLLIDGISVREWSIRNLREQISLVNQNVTLFDDDVRHNIAYGTLTQRGEKDMKAAAVAANADEFIDRLPDQYGTRLGDNGVMLSGGQRQRIAIARALLKDAPILILDEATSALDTLAEKQIQKELDKIMQGRTTLVIAHRLSTIENADMIVVMEQGRIVETGTHEDLLQKQGAYAALHHHQRLEQTEQRQTPSDTPEEGGDATLD